MKQTGSAQHRGRAAASPTSRPRRGMPAPIPIPPSSIHSSPMAFSRRWRMRARLAAARAGRRATWRSRTPQAKIVGCAPCYLKSHSQGEYVFDHAWAGRLRQGGRQLLSRSCRSPCRSRRCRAARLLVRPGRTPRTARRCWRPGSHGAGRAQPACRAARHLPERRRVDPARRPRLPASAPTSSSTGTMPGYAHLRRFPGLARLAQAQGDARRSAREALAPVLPSSG